MSNWAVRVVFEGAIAAVLTSTTSRRTALSQETPAATKTVPDTTSSVTGKRKSQAPATIGSSQIAEVVVVADRPAAGGGALMAKRGKSGCGISHQ